ncbi:hypothetical protein HW555_009180 [Spodoptera exigua]|uniref:Peptidase aspartic putative domain-containing protein n=1 Tax=Spodoptera exigua TaxID=7107 RepID=A0A835GCJ4_SPOEX|nr:hypothetical protein HW555_009180 [Spodoptera exigua]
MLLNLALKRLDPAIIHLFEMHMRDVEIPTYTDFVEFIKSQVKILDSTVHTFVACENNQTCLYCNNKDHWKLYTCPKFQAISASSRLDFIKNKRGCVNCLSATHTASQCKSIHTCRTCNKKHHSLLHLEQSSQPRSTSADAVSSSAHSQQVALCACSRVGINIPRTTVLLSTAQVYVDNKYNQYVSVRCLIDNASQNNIITSACCKKLQLNIIPLSNSVIKGVGTSSRPIIGYVEITVTAKNKANSFKITALVIDCITDKLPSHVVDTSAVQHLFELPLADPLWHVPGEVELLLGAKLFPYLLLHNKILSPTAPSAVETVFGYILMGEIPSSLSNKNDIDLNTASYFSTALNIDDSHCFLSLDESLHKFWNIEEIPSKSFMSPADRECEQLYVSTVSRDSSGRYCAALPFCKNPELLGNSYAVAYRRLINLEKTKLRDPALRASYNEIIQEVAFGLKSSPFLAMRTVRQLSEDEKHRFPRASIVASQELYMDDLANSTPTVEEAKTLSAELIALFKAGGFDLTKWAILSQSYSFFLSNPTTIPQRVLDRSANEKRFRRSDTPRRQRYGREDEEVMGLKFCNEAIMSLAQIWPLHCNHDREPNSPLQNAVKSSFILSEHAILYRPTVLSKIFMEKVPPTISAKRATSNESSKSNLPDLKFQKQALC